jgi:hypothetical protein
MTKGYNTPEGATFPLLFSSSQDWCWPVRLGNSPSKRQLGWSLANITDFKRFPFNNFTYCLTLFPKSFSSFPHGTCSLSVSRQYLALDGVYHPFRAAFPNNSTLWEHTTTHWQSMSKTGFSPSVTLHSRRLIHGPVQVSTSLDYNSDSQRRKNRLPDFKFELFPLHSQLLGESLLVSFPPLIDMLKFSG